MSAATTGTKGDEYYLAAKNTHNLKFADFDELARLLEAKKCGVVRWASVGLSNIIRLEFETSEMAEKALGVKLPARFGHPGSNSATRFYLEPWDGRALYIERMHQWNRKILQQL